MGATNYTTKTCIECGAVMENCRPARKRCPECAKVWAQIQWAESVARRKLGIAPHHVSHPGEACKGCDYYFGEHNKICNYIFIEGHRRPCPPGKDCTVRKEKGRC